MLAAIDHTHQESRHLRRWSWVTLCLGLVISALVWQRSARQMQDEANVQFVRDATEATQILDRQLDHYMDLLGSFHAMFLVSDAVSRRAFHTHFQSLGVETEYPALLAVQYARLVNHPDKAAFEASVRQDTTVSPRGYPLYRIQPDGDRPFYVATVFNEPMAGNESVMGYDTAVEPARRAVLERARDTGLPQISPPIPLLQLRGPDKLGLIVRMPVYRGGAVPGDVASRRQAYIGQISGVFRASALMGQVMPAAQWRHLHWRIDDLGPGQAPHARAALVFDSAAHGGLKLAQDRTGADTQRTRLSVAGRQWQLQFQRPHVNHALAPYPLALLAGGTLGSLGLWWALLSAANRQRRAARIGRELSRKAVESEQRLRSVIDHTVDGILTIAPTGWILGVNRAVGRIFGHSEAEMLRMHLCQLIPAAGGTSQTTSEQSIADFLATQRVGMDGVGRRTEGRRANGEVFPLDLAISTMEHDGQTQYIGVLRDLSAEQAAERAILEAHRQLNEIDEMRRVIVNNAPYAILVLNRHGVIQAINPAGEALLGYKAHEVVGRSTTQQFFDPLQ
ncbi:MAG TPA: CHASE domain-containing protein, partial [Aquabacterium sp.]|nr:CHASE domain-containing protein [Aquabacterium sp.]